MKPWWQSKTIWFNLAAAIYQVLEAAGIVAQLPDGIKETVVLVGNILLRFKSREQVTLTN